MIGAKLTDYKDPVRQSDVTFWGVIALFFGAIAVLGANLSAIFPENLTAGLHSTRVDGGNLNHLRSQVAELQAETARMRTENDRLMTKLILAEQDQGVVTRRIGALESTLPNLINADPDGVGVDMMAITSAIDNPDGEEVPADGGTVIVEQTPLNQDMPQEPESASYSAGIPPQPLPVVPGADAPPTTLKHEASYGIAIGPQVTVKDAYLAWKDITNKVGPLLLGLGPLLSGNAGAEYQRLVAGPIDDLAHADELCERMERVGIPCLTVPYVGRELPE